MNSIDVFRDEYYALLNSNPALRKKLKSSTDSLKSSSESIKISSDSVKSADEAFATLLTDKKTELVAINILPKFTIPSSGAWKKIETKIHKWLLRQGDIELCDLSFRMKPYEDFNNEVQMLNKYNTRLKNLETQLPNLMEIYKDLKAATKNAKAFDVFSGLLQPMLNRYPDILPYDWNRSTLTSNNQNKSEFYINGSLVTISEPDQKYFVTQGPLKSTAMDFWKSILHMKCKIIVNLTECEENGKSKCYPYWNQTELVSYFIDNSEDHLLTRVTVVPQKTIKFEDASFDLTEFKIYEIGGKSQSTIPEIVKLFHFRNWPDFKSPDTDKFRNFTKKIDEAFKQSSNSKLITVHCSAGVGRAGTFVCYHSILKHLEHAKSINADLPNVKINIPKHVAQLRAQRNHLIQTDCQFELIYQALIQEVKGFESRPSCVKDSKSEQT